eukprot:TRINITY_DN0_c3954_g1_i1.p1 TRINITY_DN0_c3954_g1~~TRINITY_DN0_c3954_g1_i1.p1  ORF type:complete len:235 (+),score=81.98 TRINITY_DN0_c3954_g1_i1:37-705(+)
MDSPLARARPEFNPYVDNGGTVIAISGKDFCLLGGDTRISQDYNILSRTTSKITQLTRTAAIATSGMLADIVKFHKLILARIKNYEYKMHKEPSLEALSFLVSKELYMKRFMPYYTFNLVGGLDSEGRGAVFSYDAVGSFDRVTYSSMGSGSQLVIPVLDNQLKGHNHIAEEPCESFARATDLLKDVMNSCAERDIYTGDQLELLVVTAEGSKSEFTPLRAD